MQVAIDSLFINNSQFKKLNNYNFIGIILINDTNQIILSHKRLRSETTTKSLVTNKNSLNKTLLKLILVKQKLYF